MAELDLKLISLEDVELTFTGNDGTTDDYKQHVTGVTLVPTASSRTVKTLSPKGVFTKLSKPTWTCVVAYMQDWETPESLSRYLYDHEGEEVDALFAPKAGGLAWKAKVTLTSGPIGGAGVDTDLAGSVTLGVSGRPEPVTAGAPAGG